MLCEQMSVYTIMNLSAVALSLIHILKWFKKEEGVSTVCTLVENYAKEYAEEYAKEYACLLYTSRCV